MLTPSLLVALCLVIALLGVWIIRRQEDATAQRLASYPIPRRDRDLVVRRWLPSQYARYRNPIRAFRRTARQWASGRQWSRIRHAIPATLAKLARFREEQLDLLAS